MPFQTGDPVVHPSHGIGRIARVVMMRFSEPEERLYYEIAIQHSTMWSPVDGDPATGLRPLTAAGELDRYRAVLRSRPVSLNPDSHQRRLALLAHLRPGSFLNMAEVVRDLTARGWEKPLNEADGTMLRRIKERLCQEWAVAAGVSAREATEEVDALLREARQAYQA